MKIALVSKLWEPTSPTSVGGSGVVTGILANELVKRGHKVTLFATKDSKTDAQLISFKDAAWNNDYSEPLDNLTISAAFARHTEFDVIDCHVEEKACHFAGLTDTPTLINITYAEIGDEKKVLGHYPKLNYISCSEAVQKLLPQLNWIQTIYHGIDPSLFPFEEKPKDYLLFLGRMSPQKGPDVAIRVAKKAGKKLIMAGKMVPGDKKYLESRVLPFIDNDQIVYAGVADFKTKCGLLKDASALLHPISFTEAFGLTLIEAMATGTPVISFDNGSPREIILDGKTGFIVKDEAEMAAAVLKIGTLARSDCRTHVENNFTASKMVDAYEKAYKQVSRGGIY